MTVKYSNQLYSKNLEFFIHCFNKNTDEDRMIVLFSKALREDKIMAFKNLMFLRDKIYGHGKREIFRKLLEEVILYNPTLFEKTFKFIPEIGRWDDILYLVASKYTDIKNTSRYLMYNYIIKKFKEDLVSENPSNLAKWLPRIQDKDEVKRRAAIFYSNILFKGRRDLYRKALSKIRKKLGQFETNVTEKDYNNDNIVLNAKQFEKYSKTIKRNNIKLYKELSKFRDNVKHYNKFDLQDQFEDKILFVREDIGVNFEDNDLEKSFNQEYPIKILVRKKEILRALNEIEEVNIDVEFMRKVLSRYDYIVEEYRNEEKKVFMDYLWD